MKQFLKNNKWKIAISSLAVLLPIVAGLLLWDRLPDMMVTHWGADGVADGMEGKAFAVFVPSLVMLALNWVCILFTAADKGNRNQSAKAMNLTFWLLPAISWTVNGFMYSTALGKTWGIEVLMPALFGTMFLVMGNLLPKIRQNRTLGIKISWTLNNEENWNKTHRFAGKVWVLGGALALVCIFLPGKIMIWVTMILTLLNILLPVAYSYRIYKAHRRKGIEYQISPKSKTEAAIGKGVTIFVALLLVGVAVLMFTGNVEVTLTEDALTVDSIYAQPLTVDLDAIDSVEYREYCDPGSRTMGFGSAKLSLGTFQNEEFGLYTRYSYNATDDCIVITSQGKTLVFNGKSEEQTKDIYASLEKALR